MREIVIEEHDGGYVVKVLCGESQVCTTPAQVWGFLSEQLGLTGGVGSFVPMPQGDLLSTRDASVWAREFCGIASNLGHVGLDEGWVVGWFANAIMSALDSVEQPDPTAETLQEAADDDEAAVVELVYTTDRVGDDVAIYQNGVILTSWPIGDDAMMAGYRHQCANFGIEPIELAEPATIGSCSDVSDEDVRAAGGELSIADLAQNEADIATVGQSIATYDFGPKA